MKKTLGFLALLLPLTAHAGEICTSRAQIEPKVNYCDENSAFVAPAKSCRDQYKAQVQAANAVVSKKLAALSKNANTQAQNGDFQTTQAQLTSTESTLDDLIAKGKEIFFEIDTYQEDFVLPIYAGYEEDFSLDPHSAKGQKVFRDKECYGEPMADLDKAKFEVRSIVKQLQKTKAMAAQLDAATKAQNTNLNSLGTAAVKGTGNGDPVANTKSGNSQNGQSTITGEEEMKKKDATLPGN